MPCGYCGKDRKVIAKGLCGSCYNRMKRTGTVNIPPKPVSPLHCTFESCDRPIIAKGLCEAHYRIDLRYGDPVSPFQYGERKKHPLYESWRWQIRDGVTRVPEWQDFWVFADAVGDRPGAGFRLRRYDTSKPWGPANWYWSDEAAIVANYNQNMRDARKNKSLAFKQYDLKRNYGMTLEQYGEWYRQQNGRCGICQKEGGFQDTKNGRRNTLAVDHCHGSGKIRGLLCSHCNRALGSFNDSIDILTKAIAYLKSHESLP